jgi:hypothetical protein
MSNTTSERAAFEAWARPFYILDRAADDSYAVNGAYIAWFAWQARAAMQAAEPAAVAAADPRLEDLRYIVERLARKLAKADPNSGEPTGALVYLRRVGLTGSPLRAAPDRAPSIDSAAELEAARKLIAAYESLMTGCANTSWAEWQNGNGANVGKKIEAARKKYFAISMRQPPT